MVTIAQYNNIKKQFSLTQFQSFDDKFICAKRFVQEILTKTNSLLIMGKKMLKQKSDLIQTVTFGDNLTFHTNYECDTLDGNYM